MLTAVLLINITPSSVIVNIPSYFHLHGQSFDYSLLCVFEYIYFVLLSSHEQDKRSFIIKNASFSGIALHIKDIGVMIYYQSTSHCPTCVIF